MITAKEGSSSNVVSTPCVTLLLPCYRVHEKEVVVRGARVLAVVHVFLLGGVLDVFDYQLHLFT